MDRSTAERRRGNMRVIFNNTSIIPFKWRGKFICFYCGKMYKDYPEFRKHTISHGRSSLAKVRGNKHNEIKLDVSEIVCEICQNHFKTLDVIVDHLINDHCKFYDKSIDAPFQEYRLCDLRCLHCDEQLTSFRNMIVHVNKAHPQNCFICNDCGLQCSKKRDLESHVRTYHLAGTYVCKQCGEEFNNRIELKKHRAHNHLTPCNMCGMTFLYMSKLKKHISKSHPDDENRKCNFCLKECYSALGLKMHMGKCKVKSLALVESTEDVSVYHSRERTRKSSYLTRIRKNIQCVLNMSTAVPFKFKMKFCCFHCTTWIDDFSVLILHTKSEHPFCELNSRALRACKGEKTSVKLDITSLTCKECCSPMPDLEYFIDHAIAEHGADFDKSVPFSDCFETFRINKDKTQCPECEKSFRYFSTLIRHLGAEHNHNKEICTYCGRGFRNSTSLSMHLSNVHTGACECTICNTKFQNSSALARHMGRYHDVKDFKCSQCAELFESVYKKQKHMIKVHNIGHKCEYCSKMFTRNSFMRNHVRRKHLRERTVPCAICHEKFFDNHMLRLHMVRHDGERKFKCNICMKPFLRQKNLKVHMDTHKKVYMQEML